MSAFALRSRRVVTTEGEREAAVVIDAGTIRDVVAPGALPRGMPTTECGECALLPGLVDSHVHVNEPGRTEWEGFETATRAAAAGGITTIVDMPLNSIPVTTTVAALAVKRAAAEGKVHVDCAFWGGVVPGNAGDLAALIDAGACGFKAFLIDSGIDDFPAASREDLDRAATVLAARGVPLLAHAERPATDDRFTGSKRSYASYLGSRPKAWENAAIAELVELSARRGIAIHVVHLASDEAVPVLARARAAGVPITAETCPHYLSFSSEEIGDGRTEFKCAPPIRNAANREGLWRALRDGVIDMIVSDHSPCAPALKRPDEGDFEAAWGGISSVQLALSAVWTRANALGFGLADIVRWMCGGPARLAGLASRKGRIAPGFDADLVVFDPESEFTVDPSMILHRHALTPYLGSRLKGRVRATYLRGEIAAENGSPCGPKRGVLLERIDHGSL